MSDGKISRAWAFAKAISVAAIGLWSCPAFAHIALTTPTPRSTDQKYGPCGKFNGTRSTNVTTFAPGETITVTWGEPIQHPGHFRISFDADGQDDFVDPASYTDTYTNAAVLLDNIPDQTGTLPYSVQITLPNITCANCTLQVIQMMTDKPPYAPGTNDLYYQCADLILALPGSGDAGGTGTPDAGATFDAGPDSAVPADGSSASDGGAGPDAREVGRDGSVSSPRPSSSDAASDTIDENTSGSCRCLASSPTSTPSLFDIVGLLAISFAITIHRSRKRFKDCPETRKARRPLRT